MKMVKIFGLLLTIFTFAGCGDESVDPSCTNHVVNLGPFYMRESTVNSFPYSTADSKLIFKNELNEELVFTRGFFYRDTSVFSYWNTCPFDSTVQVPYVRTYEQMLSGYTNDSLNMTLQLTYKADYSSEDEIITGESDMANAFVSRFSQNMFASLTSTIALKSGMPLFTLNKYYTSITLGQKSFDKVYSNESSFNFPTDFLIYMNYEFGIIGFQEKPSGQIWVFDRKE